MDLKLTFDDVQIIPEYSEVMSRSNVDLTTDLTPNWKIPAPLVASPMDTVAEKEMIKRLGELGGVGILHRFMKPTDQRDQIRDVRDYFDHNDINVPVVAAVGATSDYKDRAKLMVDEGLDVILIDVAHGDHILVQRAIEHIKTNYDIDVIAGNVATLDGVIRLAKWGADTIRVGLGNGSLCTTRMKTGVGIPQISALLECSKIGKVHAETGKSPCIIADGGMKTPGDIAKALATGADTAMIGSLFAGTRESPGPIQRSGKWPDEHLYKKYRGSASEESKSKRGEGSKNVEGQSTIIPYKGKVKRIFDDICDGIRSSMSYVGASDITEFQVRSSFCRVTSAGRTEAQPHLITNQQN